MARLSIVCIVLLVIFAYLEVSYAARIARSPQYFGGYGTPPPPYGFGPGCGPFGPQRPDFNSHRGHEQHSHGHHSHGHHGHESKYDIPGGSISISKTISVSSGINAQSSAGSSAGSSGGSGGSSAQSSAASNANGK